MKNILVISSATKKAYICLKTELCEDFREIDANCKQSENILFQIDNLLSCHNMDLSDINDIAVVVGPGSFTGVRIGVSLVKGFCAGNKNIKVYPISTFDFMAEHIKDERFACVLNALSGLAFVKEYDRISGKEGEEKMIEVKELCEIKSPKFGIAEEDVCGDKIDLSASKLLACAMRKIEQGETVCSKELCPVYLRNSQAEENLKKNKKI